MYAVIKKDFNNKTQMAQVKLIGIFTNKSDAFALADKHSAIGFNNDAEADDTNYTCWSANYEKRDHAYLVEVHQVNDNHFDEIELLNIKIGTDKLGYAFTW